MEVDDRGALYVPDLFNHRVLKFDDPFATDSVADDVWGQADFAGNLCNRGGANPTNNSFCFIGNWVPRAGVAVDDQRNLWVADSMNARVLRFPSTGGTIAHDADVVLGQPSFTTRNYGGSTRGLDEMLFPLDVAFDPSTHKLYVADAGFGPSDSRVLEFSPPFAAAGTPATRTLPLSLYCDSDFPNTRPAELTLDTATHQLWVENSCFFTELFSLGSTPEASLRVKMPQSDGIDVDAQGNLFTIGKWSDLYRYPRSQIGLDYQANDLLKQKVFPGSSPHTADAISGPGGVTVFGNQLIVADADRLMIWNDYNPAALEHHGQPLRNGEPADDVYGEPDLNSDGNLFRWLQYFAYPQVENGQLWVQRVTRGINDVLVFSAPLQHTPASGPLAIPLTARARGTCTSGTCSLSGTPCTTEVECTFNGYPLLGSGTLISSGSADAIDFAVALSADSIWVADRWNNRVFRIVDVWGQPYVDVVLGQADVSGTACNRNGAPSPSTLCYPYDIALDAAGNLYITDNGGEEGSNRRLLEFDASLFVFPTGQTTAKFGLPATRIFPASAQFEISPFKAAFHPNGYMVIGNNAYSGTRFPMAYLNPLGVQTPQLQLGDMSSYPAGSSYFDQYGNLYFTDSDWSRVLIYEEPFRSLAGPVTPGPTSTPGPTVPPPTLVATCVGDCNGDRRVDIDELLIMVNIALGNAPPETCLAGDANGDGRVTVDEILTAVNASLNGCRSATGD